MPNIPKLHVIGDSISVHYGPFLAIDVKNSFLYTQKEGDPGNLDIPEGANGGNSSQVLNYLQVLVARKYHTDILIINCGLHDIKRLPNAETTMISLKQYQENLLQIVAISKKISKKLIWVTTTPVDDAIHSANTQAFKRQNSDVLSYNAVATKIMTDNQIPIIDLYDFMSTIAKPWYCDHVHFPDPIRKQQANFIATQLKKINL